MEKPHSSSVEKEVVRATERKLAETALDFAFEAKSVINFFNMINEEAGKDLLQAPFEEDDVVGVLELLGRKHPRPSRAGESVERLVMLLEGESVNAIAEKLHVTRTPVTHSRSNAAKIIARELEEVLYPSFPPGEFAPDRRDSFFEQIRLALGDDLPPEYTNSEGLKKLLEIWVEHYERPALIDRQKQRLTLLLGGMSYPEVAERTDTHRSNLRRMQRNAALTIASGIKELTQEDVIQEKITRNLNDFVDRGILSTTHIRIFKQHIGIIDEPLKNGQISRNVDTCEKLRTLAVDAEIRDRNRRGRSVSNKPTQEQQRIFRRLLGSQPDAVDPISPNELVKQYEVLQRRLGYDFMDQQEPSYTAKDYSDMVSRAIVDNLEWILNPKYTSLPSES